MRYTIPKGAHYSHPRRYKLHLGKTQEKWLVKFDKSCLYTVTDGYHQWNKGTGWIYGLFNDNTSIRWAWRPKPTNQKVLEVGLYLHVEGKAIEPDYTIELPESLEETFSFVLTNNHAYGQVMLDVNGEQISQSVGMDYKIKPRIGWYNAFYFGGRRSAPQAITIDITEDEIS